MASPPPFEVEDQTDEDFFDKLVDDEFVIPASGSDSANMARVFSNLSIGDVDALEDSGDAGLVPEVQNPLESRIMQSIGAHEKDILVSEESVPMVSSDSFALGEVVESEGPVDMSFAGDRIVVSGGFVETMTEEGSSGSSSGKSGESKGTSVKEVQWSSFGVDSLQSDTGGLGSCSEFLPEDSYGSANKLKEDNDPKSTSMGNSAADLQTYVGSSDQQDALFYGAAANEQITDGKDLQYRESLYPGWKFDPSTGQWYQLDSYDVTANAQLDSHNVEQVPDNFQDKSQAAGDGFILNQSSDISYLQQTARSVVGTVDEDCKTGSVSNWNQVSQGSIEYPPNMVFDTQYPGWYYDTNTQQWHTLESYTLTVQKAGNTVQDQLSQDYNPSDGSISKQNDNLYNEVTHLEQPMIQVQGRQEMARDWDGSTNSYAQKNVWQPEPVNKSWSAVNFCGNRQIGNFYGSVGHEGKHTDQQIGFKTMESVPNHAYISNYDVTGFQGFVPAESTYAFNQPKVEQSMQPHLSHNFYGNQNSSNCSQQPFQGENASFPQFSNAPNVGRSSAGRPPHVLVTFGFGGKLIIMKDVSSFGTKLDYGSQDKIGGTASILSLMEVVMDKFDASSIVSGGSVYFHTLCRQSFPGPLVGGNAATKDVNKWIDERIMNCESPSMDFRKGELLRMLLALLKISCQHYGKLRSPFGADPSLQETDGPESAVTKLFASVRKNGSRLREYGSFTHCMQGLPSEGQIRTTAVEVQSLLVSGRRKDALQCAQEGQLWGPALVLAAQLGEKFYVDTVKQMAHHQFISGSPLRTLCLLIAGQPADVFSADSSINSTSSGTSNVPQQPTKILANGMLDDWEENLAIITANRTKDDELVIVHLGDCLWKETGEIAAAHACYLVAEANFESYSDIARICLIGSDHWKCPRTYASPEAIQRTEIYEYSKVLGNSQFILLPFQPYKLIYAYMLAEVGKISDSLRYCQASLKTLKNYGRAPEVEMWKSLFLSLEERLRTHQQGGYGTNLAPAKLVRKLFTSIDRSIHGMIGAPPPPLPPMPQISLSDNDSYSMAPKVENGPSTMSMTSLIPSASVEAITEWTADSSRKIMHNRSISEPDIGRSLKQDAGPADHAQSKSSIPGGPSRFGRIGSQLLQKTVGWVSRSRPDRQAKLGERNKFYYDDKLKRWVEEGAEPPVEEAALPPPPTSSSFQNAMSDYNINSVFKSQSLAANGGPGINSPIPSEHSSGIPPIAPSPNQFSARGGMGVRSRYVDTFNKGGGSLTTSFQSPSVPSVKPGVGAKFFIPPTPAISDEQKADATGESIQEYASTFNKVGGSLTNSFKSPSVPSVKPGVGAKFFIPTTPAISDEQKADATGESIQEYATNGGPSTSGVTEASIYSSSSSSLLSTQRFLSVGNQGSETRSGNGLASRTRAASWSGSKTNTFNTKITKINSLGDGMDVPSSFMPNNPSPIRPNSSPLQLNGGNLGDDLHEVEL